MSSQEAYHDERVTRSYFSFPAYLALAFVLAILMALPAVFYGGVGVLTEAPRFLKWYFLYCLILAAVLLAMFALQKYVLINRPIHKLSHAARKVVEGDFSIYLPIRHAPNVSHELKTPLAVISNHAQLLKTTELTEKQPEYTNTEWLRSVKAEPTISVMSNKEKSVPAPFISLRFRRNRKICNKTELTRLQRSFDGCLAEIEALERSKTSLASMCALIVGLIGTAFMAGSVFAVTAEPPMWILMIILAVPGFTGWSASYFIYQYLVRLRTVKVAPLIEQKYDELYDICERGNHLLIYFRP